VVNIYGSIKFFKLRFVKLLNVKAIAHCEGNETICLI